MYSLQWGGRKSNEWLAALFLSFFQDVLLIQPIKVIAIAMIVSLIFKKLDDDDVEDDERKRNARAASDEELTDAPQGLYADLEVPEPPDAGALQAARAKRDYDKMMWNILQEVFFYIFFLVLICFIAWGGKDDKVFGAGRVVHQQLQPVPDNFSAAYVSDGFKFWDWTIQTMVSAVYNPQMYDGTYNTIRDLNYLSDMTSFKIGPPRLRQLRMMPDTCNLLRQFRNIIHQDCIAPYSISEEEDRDFQPGWTGLLSENTSVDTLDQVERAFTFQSSFDLHGSPVFGTISLYGGGGYVAVLTRSQNKATDILMSLHRLNWIDRHTRAVFLEFTVFNPNTNLFAYVEYLFEFPTFGGTIPRPRVNAFQLYPASGPMAAMVLAAQILYVFILIYFIYTEYKKVREAGCREYIKEPWNLFEMVLIITSIVGVSMYSLKILAGQILTSDLAENLEKYTNYQTFAYYDECVNIVIGVIIFLANLKLLRLLRFNRHILFLSTTMRKAGMDLIGFTVTFFIFFLAYGFMGTVLFGQHLQGFRTLLHTLESLYSMLLGKFDFNGIRQAQSVLGPLFFVTFVMAVYFILVNMLIGILGLAFYEVRMDPSPLESDKVQFVAFGKEQASLLLLSLKELLSCKKDDDDDDDDRLVDTDSIELKEADSPGPSTSGAFGARPYLE